MNTPLVTVIIPSFNRAYTLKRAIDSVLNQTFTDFELLLIDDGSTDNTKNLISNTKIKSAIIIKKIQASAAPEIKEFF
ncbi:glycosyltransferase [bacterium]|nr:glycosyltransferase [bacterium]